MPLYKQAILIAKKDLRIQFSDKTLLLSMGAFAVLIQVILHISFDAKREVMQAVAPGVLWLPILLSALLGFSKYASAEQDNGAIHGLLLSPIDRGAIFLGKLIGNGFMVLCVALISVPSFFLFARQPYPESVVLLAVTILLGTWGFTAMGMFLSTLAIQSSITELLMPIMLFPLSVPLIIAIMRLTELALFPSLGSGFSLWLSLLVSYDIVFTVIPILLFDLLLEVKE
jgi:heme exporter protein B